MWLPGIGIPAFGGKMLSPYEILVLLILPVIAITSLQPRRMAFGLVAFAVCTLSWSNSIDRSGSTIYFVYYAAIIIPHMLFFIQIFEDDAATREFLSVFVKTGIWLAPLAILQFVSPIPTTLANNTNYAIQPAYHRTALFCPEASILAALYVVALCLAIFNSFRKIDENLPANSPSILWLVAGLATTISTSAVTVLPPLVLYILRICGVPWRTLVRYLAVSAILLAGFYFAVYATRVQNGDSTSSALLRFASMVAGGQVILKHWATGLGLGMNKNVADAVKLIYFAWTRNVVEKPGIDSFQLSLTAEMGFAPGLISIGILVYCIRLLNQRRFQKSGTIDLLAIAAVCLWLVSMLTSGYRGLVYCWLYFPIGYVVFLQARKLPTAATTENRVGPAVVHT